MITRISPFMLNSLFHLCFVKYSLRLQKKVIIKRVVGMLKIIFPAHNSWVDRLICLGKISPAFYLELSFEMHVFITSIVGFT